MVVQRIRRPIKRSSEQSRTRSLGKEYSVNHLATLPALRKAVADETILADKSVVLDITGIGVKDLKVAEKLFELPVDLKE
jgi:hypothetical protein